MPIYDLYCSDCSHEEEYLCSTFILDEEQLAKHNKNCPICLKALKRKIGRVQVIFKGSGFYATDYGRSQFNSFKKDKKEIAERDEFIEQAKKESGQ